MVRNCMTIFVLLFFLICCSNIKQLKQNRDELKKIYLETQTFEDALNLSEFYSGKYTKTVEQVEEGIEFIKGVIKKYPNNYKLKILLGNLYPQLGGIYSKKKDYTKALQYCDMGFQILDEVAKEHPNDYYLLTYRGINSISTPKMLGRWEVALEDLKKLSESDNIPESNKILGCYYYIKALKKTKQRDKAIEIKNKYKNKYPNYKELVRKYLND